MRLCQPLPCHNGIPVSALRLAWPRPFAPPPTLWLLPLLCFLFILVCPLPRHPPVHARARALLADEPGPRPMPWHLCPPSPPELPIHTPPAPHSPDTPPPSAWGVRSHANTQTPSQVRTCLFTCTRGPLARASVPWPSRLRGNQFIGILGWGAGTKGALFKFM